MDKKLVYWVETENNAFEGPERQDLINKIQSLNCSKCLMKKDRLYGFEMNQVVSGIVFYREIKREKILCKSCGTKEKLSAITLTFFAGWWSASGIILTPLTIIKDSVNFLFLEKTDERVFNRVVDDYTGYFRRRGTTNEALDRLIKKSNEDQIGHDNGFDFE